MESLTDKNFDEKTKSGKWIIDFYADWCGPCKALTPVFEELSAKFRGKINFGKLNIDSDKETAEKFTVMSIPTLLFLENGNELDRSIGSLSKETLAAKIKTDFKV